MEFFSKHREHSHFDLISSHINFSLASFISLISISKNIGEQRCLPSIILKKRMHIRKKEKREKSGYGSSPKVEERVSGGRWKIMRCATISKGWASTAIKSQAKLA